MAKKKLTQEMIKELCALKSSGLKNVAVCDGAGISESLFYDWHRKGASDRDAGKNTVYAEFLQSYKKAEAAHKLKRIKQIQEAAAEGSWQAAAWELERCYPEEYGKRVLNEVTGKDGGAIQSRVTGGVKVSGIDLSTLTEEEKRNLYDLTGKIISE
jgi:hypothetical protein